MRHRLFVPVLIVVTVALTAADWETDHGELPRSTRSGSGATPAPDPVDEGDEQSGDAAIVIGPGPNDFFDPWTGLQYWADTDTYENRTTGSAFVFDSEADVYVDDEINLALDVRGPHPVYRDADTGRSYGYDAERNRYVAEFNIEFDPTNNTYIDPNTRNTLTFDDETTYLDESLQLEFEPPSLYEHRPSGYRFEYNALADPELQGRNVTLDLDPETGSFVDPISGSELVFEPASMALLDVENGLEYLPESATYWDEDVGRTLRFDTYDRVYRDELGVAVDPFTNERIALVDEPIDGERVTATTGSAVRNEPNAPVIEPDGIAQGSAAGADGVDSGQLADTADDGTTWGRASRWVLAIGAGAVLSTLLAIAFGGRRRRGRQPIPNRGPSFADLIDVSRRLAAASSTCEVEEIAVRQAMWLTDAEAGAFVRRRDGDFEVGFETSPGLLVPDRLRDGALDRVVLAGHDLAQVSSTEPAIRQVPVSLLAIPILLGGSVHGAIVLLRDADAPFSNRERGTTTDLKSIVGGALEHAQQHERNRAEAYADAVTGLQNRRALDQRIAALGDSSIAVVMVDLDHFKNVNDTYGHQAGDDLLSAVARRIEAHIRPGDGVYRYGGEEFAIVMTDTDADTAADVAERVRASLAESPFTIGAERNRHTATASFGIAVGNTGSAVFGKADEALYRAKAAGRNRVVVTELALWGPPD